MRLLRWSLLLFACALFGVLAAMLQAAPAVRGEANLDAVRTARARALLRDHDPRRLHDGEERSLKLGGDELTLVFDYLLDAWPEGAAAIHIETGTLEARFTTRLAQLPLPAYLNLTVGLAQADNLPRLSQLRVGALEVPLVLANWLALQGVDYLYARAGMRDPGSLLRTVRFTDNALELRYQWQNQIAEQLREQLVPPEQQARILDFQRQLVLVTQRHDQAVGLPAIASPLFAFAQTRAEAGDPVADNRALLLVLARYVNDRSLSLLLPDDPQWPASRRLPVRLHGRKDLAQHFFISALLAAIGGNALASSVGVAKELDDARHGSGFSFIDLLADEAGQRFGGRATASRVEAAALQRLAATLDADTDWLPNPAGLREHLGEQEFRQRYGAIDSERFQAALADIGQRLDRMPLYR